MKRLIITLLFLGVPAEASVPPVSYPLFLRQGFSCVLEFDATPKKVVMGDLQSFQVEKMDNSIVVRSLTAYASSNMFVYFGKGEPRLFVLTASEDAEPTLYRKFESPKLPETKAARPKPVSLSRRDGIYLTSAKFDLKKDYLTIDVQIHAGSSGAVRPTWNLVRLKSGAKSIAPGKTWGERKEVQKDSSIKARFIFTKPNIRRDLKESKLILPILGRADALTLTLGGK